MINWINSRNLDKLLGVMLKIFLVIMCVSFIVGMYYIFYLSPDDYQQGAMVKIMYIHVPCAWMSLMIYGVMGLSSIGYLVWRNQLLDIVARKSAAIGFMFCLVTIITGMLWGKPIWGAWWVWDARLTSMFILACLYFSYIVLCANLEKSPIPSDIPSILAIVGLINLPVIKWSVNLWSTLHQPASVLRLDGPSIHISMLLPLLVIFLGCFSYYVVILTLRIKAEKLHKKYLRGKQSNIKI